ncbi:MAG: hypothetical protein KBA66_20320 [Leptospiraceae bacterium]|nr:hypothetical protein [Leptospiraceae bacterium]
MGIAKIQPDPAATKLVVELGDVHKGTFSTVGFKETAEKGRRDKYFIKKKEGLNGMPAPIHVFIPENGGAPKIYDFGGL